MILGQLNSIPTRKAWSTFTGISLGFFVYGLQFVISLSYILGNYLIMRFLTQRKLAMQVMIAFSAFMLFSASFYHFKIKNAKSGGWDIDLVFMIFFCKFHMMAVNYYNAGKLEDPLLSKEMSARERFNAEPLR